MKYKVLIDTIYKMNRKHLYFELILNKLVIMLIFIRLKLIPRPILMEYHLTKEIMRYITDTLGKTSNIMVYGKQALDGIHVLRTTEKEIWNSWEVVCHCISRC
jgi:hypothetical protein